MNKIGKLILKYRHENKVTQKEFAEMLGVSNTAVSKWECGSNLPDISMLNPLSKVLNVPVLSLIDDAVNLDNEQLIKEKDYQKEKEAKEKYIKEQEEYKNSIVKLKDKLKHHKILILIFILLIILNLILSIYLLKINNNLKTQNNEYENNKTLAYKLVSEDESLSLEAIVVIKGSEVVTNLNYLTYHDDKRGTDGALEVTSFELKIIADENVIYTFGQQQNNKAQNINEIIQQKNFKSKLNKIEITNAINIVDNNCDFYLEMKYMSKNESKKIVSIPLKIAELS